MYDINFPWLMELDVVVVCKFCVGAIVVVLWQIAEETKANSKLIKNSIRVQHMSRNATLEQLPNMYLWDFLHRRSWSVFCIVCTAHRNFTVSNTFFIDFYKKNVNERSHSNVEIVESRNLARGQGRRAVDPVERSENGPGLVRKLREESRRGTRLVEQVVSRGCPCCRGGSARLLTPADPAKAQLSEFGAPARLRSPVPSRSSSADTSAPVPTGFYTSFPRRLFAFAPFVTRCQLIAIRRTYR